MMNFKKWGYGLVVSLVIGLSGCYMDGRNQNEDYSAHQAHQTVKPDTSATTTSKAKGTAKSYVSKEPTQKATPGPKQTAAPQLPVIQ